MSDEIPEDRTSVYAAEGTVAHHVRECCLLIGFEPEDFIGQTLTADGFEFVVDEAMAENLRPGIEWVRERPGALFNEMRVSFDRWLPGQFGTLDVGIVSDDLIIINDLKYGAGVPVSPDHNEQLMTYALGFWDNVARHRTDADQFLLVIDQPRADGGGEWRVGLPELLEFGERLQRAYEEVHAEEPYLAAGEKQCMWCPAKDICPELARSNMAHMDAILDDLDGEELTLADADEFSPARRAAVAQNADLIKKWVDAVHARVLRDAMAGEPTPGLKAVEGRKGRREWIDTEEAERFLEDLGASEEEIWLPREMVSPTQAEKIIPKDKRKKMEDLWAQPDGKPALVPADDPKPAINRGDRLDDLPD